jgi:hypothetical protein
VKINLLGLCLFLLAASAAWAQTTPPANATVFANLDDNQNWGSCTSCAGGLNDAVYWMAQYQTSPSTDGASTQFYISGQQYSDALWWNKVGAHDSFRNFQADFWVQVDSDSQLYAQALEFDTFQFRNGVEYMFGSQCNYANARWQVWNQQTGKWINTSISCPQFTPNVWYHIIWSLHRGNDRKMHYDSLRVTQYASDNKTVVSNQLYTLNVAYPSGPMPAGWDDDLGVQFQLDLNASGGSFSEWVDQVKLTAW